jgi:hypothetical protein
MNRPLAPAMLARSRGAARDVPLWDASAAASFVAPDTAATYRRFSDLARQRHSQWIAAKEL